jgi:tetratricopeptide (TPR) repeat protein
MLYTYGFFQVCQGEYDAGLAQFERAVRLDPFDSYVTPWLYGAASCIAGRYPEAIRLLSRISDPLAEVYAWLAAAYAHMGEMESARRNCALFLAAARAEMKGFPGSRSQDWRAYCQDLTTGLPEHGRRFHEGLTLAWPAEQGAG